MARRRPNRSKLASAGVLLLGLGFALAVGGCASAPPARHEMSPEVAAAYALLERNWHAFHDLRTRADIRIRQDNKTQRLDGVLLLMTTSSMRFEALSPLGTPLLVVGGDASTLTVWETMNQRAYRLAASPDATRRWLGLALGPDELVATLSGRAVPLRNPLVAELVPADSVGPSMSLKNADVTQRIWFDPADGRTKAVEWASEKTQARAVFSTTGPDAVPTRVTLATLDGKLEVLVTYREPRLNSGFDPSLVSVTLPENVRIQDFR